MDINDSKSKKKIFIYIFVIYIKTEPLIFNKSFLFIKSIVIIRI